jgi:hypothetical protein
MRCHDYGILPYISLLVGTDFDDESVFDRQLEFTHDTKIQTAEFAISTPYPGTPCLGQDEPRGSDLESKLEQI